MLSFLSAMLLFVSTMLLFYYVEGAFELLTHGIQAIVTDYSCLQQETLCMACGKIILCQFNKIIILNDHEPLML